MFKVSNGAKIRKRYNRVPHLTQNTNGKVTRIPISPLVIILLTGLRQCFFCTIYLISSFIYASCLSLLCGLVCSLQLCAHQMGKGCIINYMLSWVLCFLVFLSFSPVVFWARYGTWLYLHLIVAFLSSLMQKDLFYTRP